MGKGGCGGSRPCLGDMQGKATVGWGQEGGRPSRLRMLAGGLHQLDVEALPLVDEERNPDVATVRAQTEEGGDGWAWPRRGAPFLGGVGGDVSAATRGCGKRGRVDRSPVMISPPDTMHVSPPLSSSSRGFDPGFA